MDENEIGGPAPPRLSAHIYCVVYVKKVLYNNNTMQCRGDTTDQMPTSWRRHRRSAATTARNACRLPRRHEERVGVVKRVALLAVRIMQLRIRDLAEVHGPAPLRRRPGGEHGRLPAAHPSAVCRVWHVNRCVAVEALGLGLWIRGVLLLVQERRCQHSTVLGSVWRRVGRDSVALLLLLLRNADRRRRTYGHVSVLCACAVNRFDAAAALPNTIAHICRIDPQRQFRRQQLDDVRRV